MKKIFFALLFLVLIGAGVLWWLMQSMPKPGAHEASAPSEMKVEDHLPESEHEHDEGEKHEAGGHDEKTAVAEHGAAEHKSEKSEHDTKSEVAELMISTEPVAAKVKVNGEEKGETPFTVKLSDKAQKIELEAEGFELYEKDAPAAKDLEDDGTQLNWKIELRAKKGALSESPRAQGKKTAKKSPVPPAPHEHAEVHRATEKVKAKVKTKVSATGETFAQGVVGPFFIQVRSMENNSAEDTETVRSQIGEYKAQLTTPVVGCAVDLGAKGKWVRILVGPYATKALAQTNLKKVQENFTEHLIVTGAQSCLANP